MLRCSAVMCTCITAVVTQHLMGLGYKIMGKNKGTGKKR